MVAVAVLLTIVGLLLLDLLVQYVQSKMAHADVAPESLPALPPGLFFHPNHCWAQLEPGGAWRIGVDALIAQLVGRIDSIKLPEPGTRVHEGDALVTLQQGAHQLVVRSPVAGEIAQANGALGPDHITGSPYTDGWLCIIRPEQLSDDTRRLAVGSDALKWQAREAGRLLDFFGTMPELISSRDAMSAGGVLGLGGAMQNVGAAEWRRFQRAFLDA